MSRHKKSYGKVKPSWFGKTKASLCARIENTLSMKPVPVQRRITDNSKRRYHRQSQWNRCEATRQQNRELAAQYPVGAMIEFHESCYRYTDNGTQERFGYIVRIRDGKYYVRLHACMRVIAVHAGEIKHRMIGANGR